MRIINRTYTKMKVTKLPSGHYRARAYLGLDERGKPVHKSFTSRDEKHAIALASAYEDQHRIVIDKASLLVTMQRFLRDREPSLSPSTFTDYQSRYRMLKKYYPALCAKHIYAISENDMRDLIASMSNLNGPHHPANTTPKALSQKTIKNYIGFLSSVFSYVNCPMPAYKLPEKEQPDIYVPTDDEIKILIDAAYGTDMYIPVLLAAFGPLRRGEICALDYPRDFSGDVIHVKEALTKKGKKTVRKTPKTQTSNRFIKMPSWIISAIAEQGYVTKLEPDHITGRFKYLLRRAGLPFFRFHDLRHYCISTLHAQGVPDAYIIKRSGHSTDAILKRVYRHILADQDAIQTEKALAHFDNIFLTRRVKNS